MDILNIKIIESAVVIAVYLLLRLGLNKYIAKTATNNSLQKTRGKIVKKASNLIFILIALIFILVIWGVAPSQLTVFLGSALSVIGIALFAQWSMLSNITSGIILYFNHNVKLDDTISVIDKDYQVDGRVSDIGLFFVRLKTTEGEIVSIPNNVFIQKMIKQKI